MRFLSLIAGAILAITLATAGATNATTCSTGDMSLTIGAANYTPTNCADEIANGNPYEETDNLGVAFSKPLLFAAKAADGGDADEIPGLEFDLTATFGVTGSYTFSWTDTAGLPDLPVLVDLAFGLFGGNNGAGYLFEDVLLTVDPTSGTGSYDITFANNGNNPPVLSHIVAALAFDRQPVPEPLSFGLFGAGIIGLGLIRRRRKSN